MVWNKTPQQVVDKIIEQLHNIELSYEDIGSMLGVSKNIVGVTARKHLSKELRKDRYSYWNRKIKLKENHMTGRIGKSHHNYKEEVLVKGYKTSSKPEWWAGFEPKPNRIFDHHLVWAEFYRQTEIPIGCVIHHIDCDKHNNDITNLQLLTISEHMQLHGHIRKVQRLVERRRG